MRRANAGFTMIEAVIVMGVAVVVASLAVPTFTNVYRDQRLNNATREMMGTIRRAQSLAASGRVLSAGPPEVRVRAAGIRIDTTTRYSIYVDSDSDPNNNNDVDVATVDLARPGQVNRIDIQSPAAGTKVRFRRDGSTSSSQTIIFRDLGRDRARTISLTAGGQPKID